jgi:hypothetical protein
MLSHSCSKVSEVIYPPAAQIRVVLEHFKTDLQNTASKERTVAALFMPVSDHLEVDILYSDNVPDS